MGSISESVPNIIDIRSDSAGFELKKLIKDGLHGKEKTLPTLLLYDNKGLKLFEDITYLDEYYLTGQEIAVLEQHAEKMADRIPQDAILLELGSGNLRKVKILLDALERAEKRVSYYALDLMHSELVRTLAAVPVGTFKHVQCFGLHGTYDDGLEWLKMPENAARPKTILSMGSSIGNFNREDAVGFVAQFGNIMEPNDSFILGLDACQDPETVYHAYNDREGVTHNFIMNGLKHANELLGYEAFNSNDWKAHGEYDQVGERHRAFVIPQKDLQVEGISLKQGERVRIEESYKYNHEQAMNLFTEAGVIEGARWTNHVQSYALHMLSRPMKMYASRPETYAANAVPTLEEWAGLWELWDKVTLQMIPTEELYEKPIKLRNACIFYLGHIPTFFDMKLVEATGMEPAEPKYFHQIFERGIDPDVDNPKHCHAHSEVPESWPELDVILKYQRTIRDRICELYNNGSATKDAWTGRTLWLGFEHEVQHLETLLYMLIQSDKTQPPAGVIKPDFEQMAVQAKREAVPNEWFDVPEQTLSLGLEDPDTPDGPVRHFGWDVEKPKYTVKVPAFKAQARPITNGEYAQYLVATKQSSIPAAWSLQERPAVSEANGLVNGEAAFEEFIQDKAVRTVYGAIPLKLALDWPLSASYDELKGCAVYMGGRIPTLEEARSIYSYASDQKKDAFSNALGKTIPAVNGHLVNEGVEETPPSNPSVNGTGITAGPTTKDLFVDLSTANVGFKHWHPMPVTPNGRKLAGQGEMGGVWEWTSSVLEQQKGFVPMKLYPAYSADFYDGKHNIVLGGSWATHPRFAGRKTVINWYQRNYLYAWAGARIIKDI
ncbi:related to TAD2-tRNA-specific adenosine deaminase 2 [Ramularia collo-cygni]|uniref:Related to TAD2-tRNA-specific adenosine deaminase 2 n=1 Tax=Ramularia collo-cygni TaxID=112498 RepID=A0A2D3V5E6_9PEZI|nr:related to TAD2-tRNA-specific adenosine deaminase 2 [Ramularia collo-cygni]CZT15493.1 related to TAD2-tRNA-specific adenosine deaminase 2 [Ramularia collo-cygni]